MARGRSRRVAERSAVGVKGPETTAVRPGVGPSRGSSSRTQPSTTMSNVDRTLPVRLRPTSPRIVEVLMRSRARRWWLPSSPLWGRAIHAWRLRSRLRAWRRRASLRAILSPSWSLKKVISSRSATTISASSESPKASAGGSVQTQRFSSSRSWWVVRIVPSRVRQRGIDATAERPGWRLSSLPAPAGVTARSQSRSAPVAHRGACSRMTSSARAMIAWSRAEVRARTTSA